VGLLRTILILLVIYYLSKLVLRFFAPQIQKFAAKKMTEQFNKQYNANQDLKREPEGKTTIVNKPNKSTNLNTDKEGEYIDFEEVD
jgi:sortase (surface protein transpeptidase)